MIALHDLLLDTRDGAAPVCVDGAVIIDFDTFRERVLSLAAALRLQPARRYALCIDDPFDFACALFALAARSLWYRLIRRRDTSPIWPMPATPH